MSGTKEGGRKVAIANKERHGNDFYRKIGAVGGSHGHTGGFYANRELARIAGRKGGRLSKRGTDGYKRPLTVGELVKAHEAYEKERIALSQVN